MTRQITIQIEYKDNGWHDCDQCGGMHQEELSYYVNNTLVWNHYTVGCYGGETSEGSEIGSIIQEIQNIMNVNNWYEDYWFQGGREKRWGDALNHISELSCYTENQLQILRIFLQEEFDIDLHIIER